MRRYIGLTPGSTSVTHVLSYINKPHSDTRRLPTVVWLFRSSRRKGFLQLHRPDTMTVGLTHVADLSINGMRSYEPSPTRWMIAFGVVVLLAVIGWGVAWPAYQRHKTIEARQQSAIEEIERIGGTVSLEIEIFRPLWLADWGIETERHSLIVDLEGTEISGDGLDLISSLTNLQKLILNNTAISDDALKHLRGMTSLRILWLDGTTITDNGLQHVRHLTNLQVLDLNNTEITDDGLKHLTGLKSLKSLYLSGTQTTDNGVKILQQALPNCTMGRYISHGDVL